MEDTLLEIIPQTKLLGTILSSDMKWHDNTDMLVVKAYKRMMILHKLYSFHVSDTDMVNIYVLYIRSILEQSCQVWHYGITDEESANLERVQRVACKVILDERYTTYDQALNDLNLEYLSTRRKLLCLNFAKKCLKHPKLRDMGPLNTGEDKNTRDMGKYWVQHAQKSRLRDSAIPQMQRALNLDQLN